MSLAISFQPPWKGSFPSFYIAHSNPPLGLLIMIPDGGPKQTFCQDSSSLAYLSPDILASHPSRSWIVQQFGGSTSYPCLALCQPCRCLDSSKSFLITSWLITILAISSCLVHVPTFPLSYWILLKKKELGNSGIFESSLISSLSYFISCSTFPLRSLSSLMDLKTSMYFLSHTELGLTWTNLEF